MDMDTQKRRAPGKAILLKAVIAIVVFACAIVGSSVLFSQPVQKPDKDSAPSFPTVSTLPQKPETMPELTPEPEPDIDDEIEPEPAAEYFTIAMMGDCVLASDHDFKEDERSYESVVGDDFEYPFSLVKHLYEDADFVIASLKCVIASHIEPQEKEVRLRADPEYANILLEGGIHFVTLGNNHTMDYGQDGYEETQEILSGNGVGFATDGGWDLYETGRGLIVGVYSMNFPSEEDVTAGVFELLDAGAELIIVAPHWGVEGSYIATEEQEQIGRAAIDAGAHIVMGTHPRTLQKMEEYNGGVIYYSLGSFTYGADQSPADMDSVIAKVMVRRDADGEITVLSMENIPCSISGDPTDNDYRPVPYEIGSEEYIRTLSKLDDIFENSDNDDSDDDQDDDSDNDASDNQNTSGGAGTETEEVNQDTSEDLDNGGDTGSGEGTESNENADDPGD